MKGDPASVKLDLLQGHRLELGLPPRPKPLRSARSLLIPSAAASLLVVAALLLMQLLIQQRERFLLAEVDRLAVIEQQTTRLRALLKQATQRAETLKADTQQITAQLVSIRSGSAFLEQLKRTTPTSVSLDSVTVEPTQIRLSGQAEGQAAKGGMAQVNAFQLNLDDLPSVPVEGARLTALNAEEGKRVGFSLDVRVDPAVIASADQLMELGAVGLARRHRLLQQLELLP